ncbi:TetR/AcrR family transcriptional regulator [Photobacterium damselae]|uniref:TetR/AcrR family transcriptional regulator n=1 Tax=Photobacterium damselae TaxID=38293 RepID=UPI0030F3A851
MNKQEKKKQIIDDTISVCSQYGFHGTGIDTITSNTGVSKATIYKYFHSKENLIAEALSTYSQQAIHDLERLFHDKKMTLQDKLEFYFNKLIYLFENDSFNGCYFQLAFSEFNLVDKKIGDICSFYKKKRLELLINLLEMENISEAKIKAKKAEIVFNGLLAMLHITKDKELLLLAKDMYISTAIGSTS